MALIWYQFIHVDLRYTLTVDIQFVAPGTLVEGRKRRDASSQPGVIVTISFNGESNVDVSALTLDLEIETAVTSAYTQMPDGFDGLIATSYPGQDVIYSKTLLKEPWISMFEITKFIRN